MAAFSGERLIARDSLSIMITSNIEGKALPTEQDQEQKDPLLNLAQCVLWEKKNRRADLYLDLGNSFYPGALSKYSFGSVIMDYFEYTDCAATLISSKDLHIGAKNLKFINRGKKTRLLSANIKRKEKTVFAPYILKTVKSKKIAFIGISSRKILVDVAERRASHIRLEDMIQAVQETVKALKKAGVNRMILLSGASTEESISLMKSFREIDMVIAGGDNRGELYRIDTTRIDIADGRSLVLMPKTKGYYLLNLELDEGIVVRSHRHYDLESHEISSGGYRQFLTRLTIWKKKFREETDREITRAEKKGVTLDDTRIAQLLRDRYDAEIAVIEKNTVNKTSLAGSVKLYDLYGISNDEYPVFTYKIKGSDLQTVLSLGDDFLVLGVKNGRVQGYDIEEKRMYLVVSTQSVYDRIKARLEKDVAFSNKWKNITEVVQADLQKEKVLFKEDYAYLERSFRGTIDFYLSNFLERAVVSQDENITEPPGELTNSYKQWGMENKIDITIYNRYHQFILTPYVNYVKMEQEETGDDGRVIKRNYWTKNLFRGTFQYNLNYFDYVNPYHKSQYETAIKKVDDKKPAMVRETIGTRIKTDLLESKLGVGYEQKIKDEKEPKIYGVEFTLALKKSFLTYMTYTLNADSFYSRTNKEDIKGRFRSELGNKLAFSVTNYLSFSLKHKWFYYYDMKFKEKYSYMQMMLAADLNADFKVF